MKKIFALALAALSTVSMFAAIDSQLTLYLDKGAKEVEARIAAGDTYSQFNAGASAAFAPMYDNPSNIGMYVQYEGGNFMELNAPQLINVPLVIVTSREAAATQNYELFAEVGASHTTPVYVTDLRPDGGGDPYTFELNDLTDYSFTLKDEAAFVEGENSVIADRFVINYNYVNLKGDFDNPNGGGAWILLNDFVAHGETATKDYTLPADAWCHFQVVENGVDYADSFDFDESNKSHQFTTPGWSEELTLHTAEAGVYTFTWNYITNTLTIDFPAPVPTTSVTTNAYGFCSFASNEAVEFLGGLKAYKGIFNPATFELDLVEVGTKVPANTGVILWNSAETAETFYYNVGVDASAADMSGNNFVGAVDATPVAGISADAIYCLHGNELMKYVGTEDIPAGKAYLPVTVSGSNPAPKHIVMRFNNTTAVDNVEAGVEAVKFVEDGQILIRRGNEVYNLQGQIVK